MTESVIERVARAPTAPSDVSVILNEIARIDTILAEGQPASPAPAKKEA